MVGLLPAALQRTLLSISPVILGEKQCIHGCTKENTNLTICAYGDLKSILMLLTQIVLTYKKSFWFAQTEKTPKFLKITTIENQNMQYWWLARCRPSTTSRKVEKRNISKIWRMQPCCFLIDCCSHCQQGGGEGNSSNKVKPIDLHQT